MNYLHHNFYYNFTASIKSGDFTVTSDILANEISDLIVFDAKKLIAALNKSDINVSEKDADETIVNQIIKEFPKNPKLKNALAFIIAESNELVNKKTQEGKNPQGKEEQLVIINSISDGLSKVSKEIEENKKDFKESTMDQIVSKAAEKKQYNRTIWIKDLQGLSAGAAIAISVIVLGAIIGLIYWKQKRDLSNEIPNAILGGPQPTPVPFNNLPNPPEPTIEPIPLKPIEPTINTPA